MRRRLRCAQGADSSQRGQNRGENQGFFHVAFHLLPIRKQRETTWVCPLITNDVPVPDTVAAKGGFKLPGSVWEILRGLPRNRSPSTHERERGRRGEAGMTTARHEAQKDAGRRGGARSWETERGKCRKVRCRDSGGKRRRIGPLERIGRSRSLGVGHEPLRRRAPVTCRSVSFRPWRGRRVGRGPSVRRARRTNPAACHGRRGSGPANGEQWTLAGTRQDEQRQAQQQAHKRRPGRPHPHLLGEARHETTDTTF